MAVATAWLVNFGGDLSAAVGEREMVHLVEAPVLATIPQTPAHCRQVLLWEGELLPVVDLTAWLTGQPAEGLLEQPVEQMNASIAIVGWQDDPTMPPEYGALLLAGAPLKVAVDDDQVCALPEQPAGWEDVAVSCFHHYGQPIPILDIPRLFSGALTRSDNVTLPT